MTTHPLVRFAIGTTFCLMALHLPGCTDTNQKCDARATTCATGDCPRCKLCEGKPSPCSLCSSKNCGRVYLPNGDASNSVLMVEKCGPREVSAGQPFKYTIKVSNRTDHALRNVVVVDELPQSLQVDAPVAGVAGWMSEPRLAGAPETNVLRFAIGDLGPKETRCIEQCGTASGTGCLSTCITAYYDLFACLRTSVTQPQLSLCMTGPQEVLICRSEQEARLRLSVRNSGTGQADNVRVAVAMTPRGGAQLAGAGETERTVGDLKCNENRDFEVCLRVPEPGEYHVVAHAMGESGLRTDPAELQFVARFARLNIRADGPPREVVGLPIEYRVIIENTGNTPDTNVSVTAELPPGVPFLEATAGGQAVGDRVVWEIGNFPPGQPRELLFRVRTAELARTINPVFTICGDCGGQQSATLQTVLEGVPALLLEMVDVQDPLRVGEVAEYRVTVMNQGSAPEANIRLAARIPDELSYVRTMGPTEPAVEGQELTFSPLPLLAPKDKATWSIFARCANPGDVRMAIQVQSEQNERPIRETESTRIY